MATRSGKVNEVQKKAGAPSARTVLFRMAGRMKATFGKLKRRGDS